jgi:hypothetical protein
MAVAGADAAGAGACAKPAIDANTTIEVRKRDRITISSRLHF